jgi:hypothetical protein
VICRRQTVARIKSTQAYISALKRGVSMSKLNLGLGLALVLGGVVALVFQAWGLAAILLVIGAVTMLGELRAHRRRMFQSKQSYNTYEIGKAHGADAANQGIMFHHQGGL